MGCCPPQEGTGEKLFCRRRRGNCGNQDGKETERGWGGGTAVTDARRGQACPPPFELLLGCGRREQRSFSCRLSADPGLPGLRLTLQVGTSSQQLPPKG